MSYQYETHFDKFYRPYYIYSFKHKKLGCIPCGIDIMYRKQHLSTIQAMNILHIALTKNIKVSLPKIEEWYKNDSLNKQLLYDTIKKLKELTTQSK